MTIFTSRLLEKASTIVETCKRADLLLATAESCTGGLFSALLTEIPGSSEVFKSGAICYSNVSKQDLLNVKIATLNEFGAVSEQVAREMAHGACKQLNVPLGIAITGTAGPGGGTAEKPVGLVYIAICKEGMTQVRKLQLTGDRSSVRMNAVESAADMLLERLSEN